MKVFVHLHIFYVQQINNFFNKLKKIEKEADFHYVFTISESVKEKEEIKKRIKNQFPYAMVFILPNIGFDIYPFVFALKQVNLDDYDFIIKLHTKGRGDKIQNVLNDVQVSDSIWEDMMVDSLIGSPIKFKRIVNKLNQNKIGICASSLCLIKDDPSRYDYYLMRINKELEKMSLKPWKKDAEFRFFAGSMVMMKAFLLKPILQYKIDDFGRSISKIKDFTLAHVLERVFTALSVSQGYEITVVEQRYYKFLARKKELINSIKESYVSKIKHLEYHLNPEKVIKKSNLFNDVWYRNSYPEVRYSGINPVKHYLSVGHNDGKNPSPDFDGYQYICFYDDVKNGMNPLLHYECFGKYENRLIFKTDRICQKEIDLIKNSQFFDEEWYMKQNPEAKKIKNNAALNYLLYGGRKGLNPSSNFCSYDYLDANPDVRMTGTNPLLHYEHKGRLQGRELFLSSSRSPVYPNDALVFKKRYSFSFPKNRRTAIVAYSCENGMISDSLIYLINGLRDISDNIILISDSPIIAKEANKLDGLISFACFEHHQEYHFGSYKRGFRFARQNGLLENDRIDELIFANASYYGPIYPFENSFELMKNKEWDFWGYTGNDSKEKHVESYFYVFNSKILESKLLDEFMYRVNLDATVKNNRFELEILLSDILVSQGMIEKTFLSEIVQSDAYASLLSFMKDYRIPLIGKNELTYTDFDSYREILDFLKETNSELFNIIKDELHRKKKGNENDQCNNTNI